MNFYGDVKVLEDKLENLLTKNNLLYEFQTKQYPITLTIKQNRTPEAQMEIYDTTDGEISSCDAILRYSFEKMNGKPSIKTEDRLVISYDLLNKITNLAKKLYAAHTAAYYAERRNPEAIRLYGDPDAEAEEQTDDLDEEASEEDFSGFLDDAAAEDEQ